MLSPEQRRSATIFARITEANKRFIVEKRKQLNMSEGPFLNKVFELLRTTKEGAKLLAVKKENK